MPNPYRTVLLSQAAQTVLGSAILAENLTFALTEDFGTIAQENSPSGAGNGKASIGPSSQGEIWNAGYIASVHCSTRVKESQCRIYCGTDATPQFFTDATTWGSTGDSTGNTPEIRTGQQVFAVWADGDPGAVAYLSVNGSRMI